MEIRTKVITDANQKKTSKKQKLSSIQLYTCWSSSMKIHQPAVPEKIQKERFHTTKTQATQTIVAVLLLDRDEILVALQKIMLGVSQIPTPNITQP